MSSRIEWEPGEGYATWRCGQYELRKRENGWRLFRDGSFVFSASTFQTIEKFLLGRRYADKHANEGP